MDFLDCVNWCGEADNLVLYISETRMSILLEQGTFDSLHQELSYSDRSPKGSRSAWTCPRQETVNDMTLIAALAQIDKTDIQSDS